MGIVVSEVPVDLRYDVEGPPTIAYQVVAARLSSGHQHAMKRAKCYGVEIVPCEDAVAVQENALNVLHEYLNRTCDVVVHDAPEALNAHIVSRVCAP